MQQGPEVPIYVSALDFVGKRTALFGMTQDGQVEHGEEDSGVGEGSLSDTEVKIDGQPLTPVGQIIFDINGEYANAESAG